MRPTNISFTEEEHIRLSKATAKKQIYKTKSKAGVLRWLVQNCMNEDGDPVIPEMLRPKFIIPEKEVEVFTPPSPRKSFWGNEVPEESLDDISQATRGGWTETLKRKFFKRDIDKNPEQ